MIKACSPRGHPSTTLGIMASNALDTKINRLIGATGRLPIIATFIRIPLIRRILLNLPGSRALYGSGWHVLHPFDRAYGTETSGFVSTEQLPKDAPNRSAAIFYAGSQPSILRAALATLPSVETSTFIDLGCGKGRALLVASELPFKRIIGIELSPKLADIAQANAAIVAKRFPRRTAVEVCVADASAYALPTGDIVLFLYHPFADYLVAKVVANIEIALQIEQRRIYAIYYNPVAGHHFDASLVLSRHLACRLPYAPDELGYGPDSDDSLVIWEGGTNQLRR